MRLLLAGSLISTTICPSDSTTSQTSRVGFQNEDTARLTIASHLQFDDEIAANVQNNNTSYAHALHVAEFFVPDCGTHYVTTMEAGAVLSQVDHVKSLYFSSSEKINLTVTASASANSLGNKGMMEWNDCVHMQSPWLH